MGPSSPHTTLQFNRKLPALAENLAVRYPRRTDSEKPKASDAPSDTGLLERLGFQTSVPLSVIAEERLNVAKRDVKRKQLEELVKAPLAQQAPQKPGPRKSKPSEFRSDAVRSKVQGLLSCCQLPSGAETASPGVKPHLYASPQDKCAFPLSRSLPTAEVGAKSYPKPAESPSMLELRRLEKELSGCIQKIEGVATKDNLEEDLDQVEAEQNSFARQEQAVRTTLVLYGLLEQVKEIQEDLDKLSPFKIKNTTEELDSLLERTQSLRKKKKYFPRIRSQFPLNFPRGLESSYITSPEKEKQPSLTKEKLTQEGRRTVGRKLLEDKGRCSSLFPLFQILNDELGSQSEDDFSSSERNVIVKVRPSSAKAKTGKKRSLKANGTLPRRGIRASRKK